MERAIRHYMTPAPQVIRSDATAATAHQLMRSHGIRHLPVADDSYPVGIVTERDLQILESVRDVGTRSLHVSDGMTRNPFVVTPDVNVDLVAETMAERHFGSVIVVDDGRIVGMFTTVDALRLVAGLGAQVWNPSTCNQWGGIVDPPPALRRA
ncbi:MAG: hypothetical protein NVS3B20_15890 [Polyangiales bacterium]